MIQEFNNGYSAVMMGDVFNPPQALADGAFPLIIADPPYGNIVRKAWDNWTYVEYKKLAQLCERVLKPGGSAYIWGGIGKKGNRPFFQFLGNVESDTNLTLKNVITWSKKRAYGKKDDYLFTREELAWLIKGDKPCTFNIPYLDVKRGYEGYNKNYPAKSEFKRRTNVWTDVTEIFRGKKHIAEKPERLAEILIETHTNEGGVVLDLFSGSGNVSVVAQRMKRNFVAIENSEEEYKKILERLTGE